MVDLEVDFINFNFVSIQCVFICTYYNVYIHSIQCANLIIYLKSSEYADEFFQFEKNAHCRFVISIGVLQN